MKSSKFVQLSIIGLTLTLAFTGCKNPQGLTEIHGTRQPRISEPSITPPIEDTNKFTIQSEPELPHPQPPTDYDRWTADTKMFEAQTIYFAFDSVKIQNSEKGKTEIVAAYLQSNPKCAMRIEGNCDERGTEEYNRSLGERRALAAREALIGAGVAPERVVTVSFGEDNPADPAHNEAAWKKNRRATFVLLTPPQ